MGYTKTLRNSTWRNWAIVIRNLLTECDSSFYTSAELQDKLDYTINMNYQRVLRTFDNELFVLIYFDNDGESYDKNKHRDLVIKKCDHPEHRGNSRKIINRSNLIFSKKFINLFDKIMKTRVFLLEEAKKLKITGRHGFVSNGKALPNYVCRYLQKLFTITYTNLFFVFNEKRSIKEAFQKLAKYLRKHYYARYRKNIYSYFGEDSINNPQSNELLDQDLFWDDENEDEDDFLTEIKFKSFAELYEKSMNYIWLKWKIEEKTKWSFDSKLKVKERLIQFKNYIEHRNEHFDVYEEDKKFEIFMNNQYREQGVIQQSASFKNVCEKLESLLVDDSKKEEVKEESQLANPINEELPNLNVYTFSTVDIDIDKIMIPTQMSINKGKKLPREIIWSSFEFDVSHLQSFTLIFYLQIYMRETDDRFDSFDEIQYRNQKQMIFDKDLVKFCKNVDELYARNIEMNTLSDDILRLVKELNTTSFKNESDMASILTMLCERHPLYSFEINYYHKCKLKKKGEVAQIKSTTFIHPYFNYVWEINRDEIISIDDTFLSREFYDPMVKLFLYWWKPNHFDIKINFLSRFFLMNIEVQKSDESSSSMWRFKSSIYLDRMNGSYLKLLAIMMSSSVSYLWIVRMDDLHKNTDEDSVWYIYNPSVIPTLYELPERNIQDTFIEINESEFSPNTLPCLVLYEKIN